MTDVQKRWLAMLAKLVHPSDPVAAGKALSAMGPMLDFPDSAYTLPSLEAVALKVRRLPAYADLREAISEWWKEHRPTPPAIAAVRETWDAKLERERCEALSDWSDPVRIRGSLDAISRDHPMREMCGRLLSGLVARHAPQNLYLIPPEWQK